MGQDRVVDQVMNVRYFVARLTGSIRTGVGRIRPSESVVANGARTVALTIVMALVLKMFVVEAFRIPSASMENTLRVGDYLLVNKLAYGLRTPRHVPFVSSILSSFEIPFFTRVQRGDVVVFEFPGTTQEIVPSESVDFIKRCIGLPGDAVEIRSGAVRVNGNVLPMPLNSIGNLRERGSHWPELYPPGSGFTEKDYGPITVPRRGTSIPLNALTLERWRVFIEREGHHVADSPDGSILVDGKSSTDYRIRRNYYFLLGDNRGNSLDSRYWGFVPEENLVGEAILVYWSWDPDVPIDNWWERLSTIRWDRIGKTVR
jgi:signal peptidase I